MIGQVLFTIGIIILLLIGLAIMILIIGTSKWEDDHYDFDEEPDTDDKSDTAK